uniref:Palmitoyltransferase n=1 Tax=Tetraodon nigroviridis TaxID=99883 RepID=H3C8P8_TETNG
NMLRSVFGSGFAVRTAHVVLTWLITLILFLHDTELRRQEQPGQPGQPVLFVLLVLVSVLLYLAVSLMDPGFILAEDAGLQVPLGVTEEQQDMIPPSAASQRRRRCAHCLVQQPMRSKHCQACRRCVRRYDHHCPWMENCVGERNHRWFMLYLLVQLLVLLWGLHIASTGFQAGGAWRPWLRANDRWFMLYLLVQLLVLLWGLHIGSSHLYLISLNTTTWEFMCRHRISYLRHCGADQNPFDRGPAHNLWGFFCVWGTVVWEQVYFQEGSDQLV